MPEVLARDLATNGSSYDPGSSGTSELRSRRPGLQPPVHFGFLGLRHFSRVSVRNGANSWWRTLLRSQKLDAHSFFVLTAPG
jgi:hypothetical protein